MTEYQVFKWFLLFLILMAAVAGLVACTNPVAPSKSPKEIPCVQSDSSSAPFFTCTNG